MDPYRKKEVRGVARALIDRLWNCREQIWELPPTSPVHMVPVPVERVARDLLSLELIQVQALPPFEDGSPVAGLWDPRRRRIVVAAGQRRQVFRFTIAHEIGHAVLHPSIVDLHRTRPFDSHDDSAGPQPMQEREANLFAAEFLMPQPLLDEIFRFMYGNQISLSTVDDHLLHSLKARHRRPLDFRTFARLNSRERALVIAENSVVRGLPVKSLMDVFEVSRKAAAIQLEDYALVS